MISIQSSLSEIEQCYRARAQVLDCYIAAIKGAGQYAVELDENLTKPHRKYLDALAIAVASGAPEALEESRATLRGLLRDYRDKAGQYLARLREELAGTARALQDTLNAFCQTDGDHEKRLRGALVKLRTVAASPEGGAMGMAVRGAVDTIEQSLEEIRKLHQATVSQFLVEIRVLHQRIDELQTAASIDDLTKLFNREEMERQIRDARAGSYCLLLLQVNGLRVPSVEAELAGAFTRRLRNSVPADTVLGRWSNEKFIAMLGMTQPEAIAKGKWIAEHLSGSYSCLQRGKTVRPSLQLSVAVVDTGGATPDSILQRVGDFLGRV